MALMELPTWLRSSPVAQQAQQQAQAALDDQRAAAVAELRELDAREAKLVPELEAVISSASTALADARIAVEVAENHLRTALRDKAAALYPFTRRRDQLTSALTGHLSPECVTAALSTLLMMEETIRELPACEDAKEYSARANRMAAIRDARPALIELQTAGTDNLDAQVRKILGSIPAI